MRVVKIHVVPLENTKEIEGVSHTEHLNVELSHFLIYPQGTAQKKTAVGLILKDKAGNSYTAGLTGAMFESLAAALRGHEEKLLDGN